MKKNYEHNPVSACVQRRIALLKKMLHGYDKSIERLHQFASGQLTLKNKGYTDAAESYRRTSSDDQRLSWTIDNLKMQIRLYTHEMAVLQTFYETEPTQSPPRKSRP